MGTGRPPGAIPPAVATLPSSLRGLVRRYGAKSDPLQWAVRQIPGGLTAIVRLLQVSDDPDAKHFVETWRRGDNQYTGTALSEVLERAEMAPRDFVAMVSRVAFDFNIAIGRSIAAFGYPKMMKASMQRAQEPEATDERRLHFQASGYVPTAKGIQIGIKNTNVQSDDVPPSPGRPASFDRTARQIVRDLPPAE